jgi:hypothetical protein
MTEQMHIIDNKRVLMTEDEWKHYQSICTAYDDPPQMRGKDLFQNLFETDDHGMILFLKPPTTTCTYEVFLFMVALMVHQRLRDAAKQVQAMHATIDGRIAAAIGKENEHIKALENRIAELEGKTK